MLFLISILLTIFPMKLMSNTICSSNEITLVSDSHFRVKDESKISKIKI